ncbi:hypothetical protein [Acrocarpospora catenulata]|uniref:hypothetical protein n=1 Tax=Acrocarpospora catenulata TaxID=2836182 RepID=UPI001BD9DC36|nr:hypothetical protein [Acrocarpospora catenulata]
MHPTLPELIQLKHPELSQEAERRRSAAAHRRTCALRGPRFWTRRDRLDSR